MPYLKHNSKPVSLTFYEIRPLNRHNDFKSKNFDYLLIQMHFAVRNNDCFERPEKIQTWINEDLFITRRKRRHVGKN